MKNISLILIIIITMILLTNRCSRNSDTKDSELLQIVATTSIITDVLANIVGEKAEVFTLIGYGKDPHSFDPAPKDIAKIEDADIIFTNGFGLEEYLLELINNRFGEEE